MGLCNLWRVSERRTMMNFQATLFIGALVAVSGASATDCQAMDSVFAALSNMTASYNLTAEDVYNMTMEGDISLDDMIEGVMDYASSQGWSLEDVFGTMIAALPMEAQEALQEMANGMTLEEVIDLVQKGEVDLEDIADSIEEYVSEQGWTLPDVMQSIKESCPHVFDQWFGHYDWDEYYDNFNGTDFYTNY